MPSSPIAYARSTGITLSQAALFWTRVSSLQRAKMPPRAPLRFTTASPADRSSAPPSGGRLQTLRPSPRWALPQVEAHAAPCGAASNHVPCPFPQSHGWPSFRDAEVIWDDVRVLPDGEAVSVAGTHLGHNLPDRKVRAAPESRSLEGIGPHTTPVNPAGQPLLHQPRVGRRSPPGLGGASTHGTLFQVATRRAWRAGRVARLC